MNGFFNSNFSTLPAALDAASTRNTIIAQNIANAETPGYKRKEVDFETYLQQAMGDGDGLELKKTNDKHFKNIPQQLEMLKPESEPARIPELPTTAITWTLTNKRLCWQPIPYAIRH